MVIFCKGVRFQLNGGEFFDSGTLNVNDIVDLSEPVENGLICQSQMTTSEATLGSGDWYHNPEQQSTNTNDGATDEILGVGSRGWQRARRTTSDNNQRAILRRDTRAGVGPTQEGVFTCQITEDINPVRSLNILYPSELSS